MILYFIVYKVYKIKLHAYLKYKINTIRNVDILLIKGIFIINLEYLKSNMKSFELKLRCLVFLNCHR